METPKIPTLKDAQKPQVKIKGLGAGLTLFDRLKQFKKKDLAFILAGLGTLFMAPLAEHFMMAPENGDATMSPGWGGKGSGSNFFGSGGSPYEPGNNSIASGNAIGGGGDIITPLNVRDPSALVMGPGSSQQPPAGSVTPPSPPPTAPARSDSDLKDALAGAASRAASAAVKRAPLPVPKVALGGSGLRGLGVAGGGSSASAGMAAPGAAAGSVGGGGGSGLNLVRTAPNFKGVAGPRGSGNPQGLDGTKKAGANAGDAFSRAGNALANLNGAASEQIPTGGTGFNGGGQGGSGANDKAPGGGGPGGSKSVGESLAFIAAKERMMKNLELEFEKRKLKDPELLLYGIRNDMLKSIATKGIAEPLGAWLGGIISKGPNGGADASVYRCTGFPDVPVASAKKCADDKDFGCFSAATSGAVVYRTGPGTSVPCTIVGGEAAPGGAAPEDAVSGDMTGSRGNRNYRAAAGLGSSCEKLDDEIKAQESIIGSNPSDTTAPKKLAAAKNVRDATGQMISVRDALTGKATSDNCGATPLRSDKSVAEYINEAITENLLDESGVPLMVSTALKGEEGDYRQNILDARTAHGNAEALLAKAKTAYAEVDVEAFATTAFGLNDATFNNIKTRGTQAHTGIAQELPKFEAVLKALDTEIIRAENALTTIKGVVGVNAAHTKMLEDAKVVDPALTTNPNAGDNTPAPPANGNQAAASPDTAGEARDVTQKTETAQGIVTTGAKAASDMKKAKEADPKYEAPPAERQKVTATWEPLGAMQDAQQAVLSSVITNVGEIKSGKIPGAPAGNGGATSE